MVMQMRLTHRVTINGPGGSVVREILRKRIIIPDRILKIVVSEHLIGEEDVVEQVTHRHR